MQKNYSLSGKRCERDDRITQTGFSLIEMLIALAVIAMLSVLAQLIIRTGMLQLKQVTASDSAVGNELVEAVQWLENDILQWHGDQPWKFLGTTDAQRCLVSWSFTTGNAPVTDGADFAREIVHYYLHGDVLMRDNVRGDDVVSSRELLHGVSCLHPQFWQGQQWHDVPDTRYMIEGIALSLAWKGPGVKRIWPVAVTYENEK